VAAEIVAYNVRLLQIQRLSQAANIGRQLGLRSRRPPNAGRPSCPSRARSKCKGSRGSSIGTHSSARPSAVAPTTPTTWLSCRRTRHGCGVARLDRARAPRIGSATRSPATWTGLPAPGRPPLMSEMGNLLCRMWRQLVDSRGAARSVAPLLPGWSDVSESATSLGSWSNDARPNRQRTTGSRHERAIHAIALPGPEMSISSPVIRLSRESCTLTEAPAPNGPFRSQAGWAARPLSDPGLTQGRPPLAQARCVE
jgi:hypothetical protein